MKNNRLLITLKATETSQYIVDGSKVSTRCTSHKGARKQLKKYNKEIVLEAIFKDETGLEQTIS